MQDFVLESRKLIVKKLNFSSKTLKNAFYFIFFFISYFIIFILFHALCHTFQIWKKSDGGIIYNVMNWLIKISKCFRVTEQWLVTSSMPFLHNLIHWKTKINLTFLKLFDNSFSKYQSFSIIPFFLLKISNKMCY